MADLIGIVFISKPEFLFGSNSVYSHTDQIYGVSIAVVSSLWVSAWRTLIKKLSHRGTLDIMLLNIFHGIGGVPICSVLSLFFGPWTITLSRDVWILLAVYGPTCLLQMLLQTAALDKTDAKTVAVSATISTVLTYVVQLIVFHSEFDPVMIVGALTITLTVVIWHIKRLQED